MTVTRMMTKKLRPLVPSSPTKNETPAASHFPFEKASPMDPTKLDAKDCRRVGYRTMHIACSRSLDSKCTGCAEKAREMKVEMEELVEVERTLDD